MLNTFLQMLQTVVVARSQLSAFLSEERSSDTQRYCLLPPS